jgi:hypothetical protein
MRIRLDKNKIWFLPENDEEPLVVLVLHSKGTERIECKQIIKMGQEYTVHLGIKTIEEVKG